MSNRTRAFTARELGLTKRELERLTGREKRVVRSSPSLRPYHPYRSKWEAEYSEYLALQKAAGLIDDFGYETERLEIGAGAVYTPDFPVMRTDGAIEMREVKGYRREAAMVRLRVAAKLYPQFRFVLVTKVRGEWRHQVIGGK